MKKLVALVLCLLSLQAFACSDEIRLVQLDATGTVANLRQLCPLNFMTQPYLMVQDPYTESLVIANIAGMTWDGATLTATGTQADWLATSGAAQILNRPTLATVATSGSYNDLSNKPTLPGARVFSNTTRALNTCFQLSTTRDAHVTYPVDVGTSLSLSGGSQGTVTLKTFTSSACTTGAQEQAHFTNGQTGTLTVGLNLSQTVTGSLSAVIPAGAWAELVTTSTTGSPTFTSGIGQEVLE